MFGFKKKDGQDILNPLNINKNSMVEFKLKELEEQGFFTFGKIIHMDVGQRPFTRYLVYSRSEETEYIFEVYKGEEEGQFETYLYFLDDTVPFSEEFLEVVGQKCITTPDGTEYERCTMPENDYRIDGVQGSIKVFDLNSEKIEYESEVEVWDYQRDAEGITEYLNIEMLKTNGMFRIFIGQRFEGSLYKIYQGMEEK
ncbi:hypothetical protein [Clostridium sp. BNL1100]|uniref:hypothetical protein n=1 Tax=Clostridium sp. BNL1100 TaxID=755731 RepID=UPI00024A7EC7|nr:hypothetical protein [Clostridium sp. BNL1100]AEY64549.1 hypothetical protein Clo1100_0261 [Clostridium sp. BNL1100]